MIGSPGQGIVNCRRDASAITGVNISLPETDVALGRRAVVSEQRIETLRPGERAVFYIPIPNCIVCSPGNKRKIIIARRRIIFRRGESCFTFIRDLFEMSCDQPIERRRWERRFCNLFPFRPIACVTTIKPALLKASSMPLKSCPRVRARSDS